LSTDVAGYREFVTGRLDQLRRTAYLLCGDWHNADDLVSVVLVKLYRHWARVSTMDNLDAYARKTLVRALLDERRRPWRREVATETLPERPASSRLDPADRLTLLGHLAELPPRRRAVLVLRYFCDLSVEETAEALDCSPGTVKSQAARALETLRTRLVGVPGIDATVRED
jgi:RNA polymerase sigma-70 factor (sigma-E family)